MVYQLDSMPQQELLRVNDLDPTEQAAYARQGERYLLIRSILRKELAQRSGEAAHDIRFTYGPNGKPEYAAQPFNISHSGELLCLAFHHSSIGVDIERMSARRHMPRLARRIMCPEQLDAWLQRGSRPEEFYDCWCTAEALAKQSGESVWKAQERPFLWSPGGIRLLYESRLSVKLFSPVESYRGAVAWQP